MSLPLRLSLGLTGYPLGHSLSPRLHTAALGAAGLEGEYRLYPIPPDETLRNELGRLLDEMRHGRLHGLNITVPHKTAVLPLLDELTAESAAVGAVNTVFMRNSRSVGHNTDIGGFAADLQRLFPQIFERRTAPGRAVVLGAGGAARAVVYALADRRPVSVVARRVEQAEVLCESLRGSLPGAELQAFAPADLACVDLSSVTLLVNATSAGMAPQLQVSPWPDALPLPLGAYIYDLVYSPAETPLLRAARLAGAPAANGLGMLVEQAALAFACWTGRQVPRRALWDALQDKESE